MRRWNDVRRCSFSKILMTALVMLGSCGAATACDPQLQGRLAAARPSRARRAQAAAAPRATDLVECPRCGLFVPNGTICRSVERVPVPPQLSAAGPP